MTTTLIRQLHFKLTYALEGQTYTETRWVLPTFAARTSGSWANWDNAADVDEHDGSLHLVVDVVLPDHMARVPLAVLDAVLDEVRESATTLGYALGETFVDAGEDSTGQIVGLVDQPADTHGLSAVTDWPAPVHDTPTSAPTSVVAGPLLAFDVEGGPFDAPTDRDRITCTLTGQIVSGYGGNQNVYALAPSPESDDNETLLADLVTAIERDGIDAVSRRYTGQYLAIADFDNVHGLGQAITAITLAA